jgi:catechol 2,3-dioxygenase-like lactoylglutathione lyase family enzyme
MRFSGLVKAGTAVNQALKVGRLNHVAMAVPDLTASANQWKSVFGAVVSDPIPLPEHGVTTVFVELANTKFELLHPLGEARFPPCHVLLFVFSFLLIFCYTVPFLVS